MKLFCGILLACLSLFSCKQQSTNEQQAFAELDRLFSNYCLNEHSTQFTSHDLIIFTKQGRWVPSYYLVVKKMQNNIAVTYHEVDKINEVANPDMLFFRGITFSIDSNKWNEIAHQSEALLNGVGEDGYGNGVTDATDYVLFYNDQACVVNTGTDAERFEEFAKYLNDNVIDPAKKLKRSISSEQNESEGE
jgi:hypothetical protein